MTERRPEQRERGWAAAWNRLVAVNVVNAETARLGRLFNVTMVLSVGVGLVLAGVFMVANAQGVLLELPLLMRAPLFPLLLVGLSIYCFIQSKRGDVWTGTRLFIWGNSLGLMVMTFTLGGLRSPGWILFLWPVTLAGTFIRPLMGLHMAVAVAGYYALLLLLARSGIYVPPVQLSLDAFHFLSQAVILTMMVFVAGGVSFLNMSSLQRALSRWQATQQELEASQRTLERRVTERTTELERRAQQLTTIADLTRAVAAAPDLQRLFDTAVRLIASRLDYDHVGIFLVDPSGEWAVLRAASSEGGQRMLARGHRLRVGEQGIVGNVAHTGLARFAFSVGEDAVWFNNPDLPKTQSELSLPLIAQSQRTVGVLDIQTETPAAFTEADAEVLRILADGIAVAITNMASQEETREALERLERYQEQDAIAAWRRALTRRKMHVGYTYDSGLVNRMDSATEEADDTGPGAIAPDLVAGIHEVTTRLTENGQHVLLAPIRVHNRNMGVLSFEKSSPWGDEQVQLAQFVVAQLDLALDNVRLLEETRLRANQERARSEIVGRIRAMTSTDAILRNAARELGMALQVERSRVQLLPPGEGQPESL